MKTWMFLMFTVQFMAFILEPIARPGTFRSYLYSMWYCTQEANNIINCDPSASHVMFVIHTLILRISIPLLLIHVVISFGVKKSL